MTVLFWGDKHQLVHKGTDRRMDHGARMTLPWCAALLALVTAQE